MSNVNYKAATILLVEDDDIDAKGVERAFKRLKILNSVVRAKDGIEALEFLETEAVNRPYIILLDLNMPRMGGLEMLDALRKSRWKDSVVFVLTTSKADEDKFAAYDQHIAGYIVKGNLDIGFEQLVTMIDHYWKIVELPMH